ncbi:uncharacterized protein C6orf132 homolog [Syngnathus scovelli]|uniref:uncharacterized protein C6orf132 homolog n=1 Tax=Syngnathus scovelli TaxID=161590 RepID=UPI00210F5599|nr:titin-like [Syngnathus scovelli]
MACREPGGSLILLYFGLFLLAAGTFCQCSQLARLKTSVKFRHKSPVTPNRNDGSYSGRLLIFQQADPPNKATSQMINADSNYQADMGWDVYGRPNMEVDRFSEAGTAVTDQLIKMDPKVECTTDSMKLQVQDISSAPGSLILVDRGHLSPLPLSKLPQSCGYTIKSTPKDMVLVAPYNGCFVALEEDSYVLPLLWWGLPVTMSCPLMRPSSSRSPMVTCHTEGMIVKTEWIIPLSKIQINVNGKWEPLNATLHKCGIGVVDNAKGVVLSVHYGACVEKKNGMYSVELAGEGATKISCPSMAQSLSEPTKSLESPNIGLHPSHSFYYPLSSHYKPVPHNPGPVGNPIQMGSSPGHAEQPVNHLLPVPPENKPDKPKPPPQSFQPPTPETPFHLFPYPLNPTPGPVIDPVQMPTVAPHKTEVPPGHVEKLHYPFLPNLESENKPSEGSKTVPSRDSSKPQSPKVPSGPFKKPYYPFLPNPLFENKPIKDTKVVQVSQQYPVPPSQGAKPASPKYPLYPLRRPDVKPTSSPQLPQAHNPEARPVSSGQPLYPNLYSFFPDPENERRPPQPQEPEKLPGNVPQPVTTYPSNLMPGFGLKPNDKPMPAPQQPEDPPIQIQQQKYLFTYPLYPMPNPKKTIKDSKIVIPPVKVQEPAYQYSHPYPYPFSSLPNTKDSVKKPILDPQNPKVLSSPVHHHPPNPYPYLVYPMESTKRPMPSPQKPMVTPGALDKPIDPYLYPFYPMPSPNKPTKKPMPNSQKPEVTPGQVDEPIKPYPYPLYPMPSPEETTKRPMPNPQKTEVTPGDVDEPVDPYPLYPTPNPEDATKMPMPNPKNPKVIPGVVEQSIDPYSNPLYSMPSPKEPTNKPMPNRQIPGVPSGHVEQPIAPYPYPLNPMFSPQKPTQKPKPTLQEPEGPPNKVEPSTNAYPYPLYPLPSPKVSAKRPMLQLWPFKPQKLPMPPGPVKPASNQYQYSFYLKPGPKEQANNPMPNPWLIKPQQPEDPHGHVKPPSNPYPLPLDPRPSSKDSAEHQKPYPWPFKPLELGVPQGQLRLSAPTAFPLYPSPSSKEPAERAMLRPWLWKPQESEAPLGPVKQPFNHFWHGNKLSVKPPKAPQPPEFPQSPVQQPYNTYLVYPMPVPELPKKPIPFPQPTDSKQQPEISVHVQPPSNPVYPFDNGAVIKNPPAPPKPEVPGNVYWPLESQTPIRPVGAIHKSPNQKPKVEKAEPIRPPDDDMPYPQWLHSVTLPSAKEPQSTNSAVVPHGSTNDCIKLCAVGFSNCCPQITFHQHLYLSSPEQYGEVARVVSQEFPFVASMAYYRPGSRTSHTLPAQKLDEENYNRRNPTDSIPNNRPYHPQQGGRSASLSESIADRVGTPKRQIRPHLAPKHHSWYTELPFESSPKLPSQFSPQVMPFRIHSPLYTPVSQEAQNKQPKNPNGQFAVFNDQPGQNAKSSVSHDLQQQNPNHMRAPGTFSLGSPISHLGVQEELSPFFHYSMLNDAEATTQNLQHSSHRNKPKLSSKRDQTGHSSKPRGYILLQRGPPGKEPKGSMASTNFRVLDQNIPVGHVSPLHLQHVNTWDSKPQHDGLIGYKNEANPPRVPESKE